MLINSIKTIFRPIYVPLINQYRYWSNEKAFIKRLKITNEVNSFIIGSPLYRNIGDSAIFLAQKRFIELCGSPTKEITFTEFYTFRQTIKRIINKKCNIYGMGGGNMGNQWIGEDKIRGDVIKDYPNNKIIVFPQTVHFVGDIENAKREFELTYGGHNKLTIVAREKRSFEILNNLNLNANFILSPDIVLSCTKEDFGVISRERHGVIFVMRNDAERVVQEEMWEQLKKIVIQNGKTIFSTDMYSDIPITKENRIEIVRQKIQEFCNAELVITDRLHGMIFSAITETPCIALNNYNYKIKGTYDWISYLPYIRYAETVHEAERAIPELLDIEECCFDNTPILPYFQELAKVVKAV